MNKFNAKAVRLLYSFFSDWNSKRFSKTDYVEKANFQIRLLFQADAIWYFIKYYLGNECNNCPSGWSSHIIGTTRKCLFIAKSKIEISQLDTFCQSLNATVPYPKTNEENQNYLDALETRNVTTSVAIRSCHGIVELHRHGHWNPFPTETSLNAVCEKASIAKTGRAKRQASLGNFFHTGVFS